MTITGMGQIHLQLYGLFLRVYLRQCSTSTLYCKIHVWLPWAAVNNTQPKPNTWKKKKQGRCTVTTIFYQQFSSTQTTRPRHLSTSHSFFSSVLTQLLVPRSPTGCHKTAHNWTCTPSVSLVDDTRGCGAFPRTDRQLRYISVFILQAPILCWKWCNISHPFGCN